MGRIQTMKVWGFLSFLAILMNAASLSYGQTNTFPSSGNVGIGTTSPGSLLDISSSGGGTVQLSDTSGGSARNYRLLTRITDFADFGVQQSTTAGGLTYATRFYINPSGNVGIGTTNPTSKLHVAGDATIDGNIAAKYQDVAEWVRTPAHLAPGTVVVIDPVENNRVLPASRPYDTGVAGVVSAQPGVILGEPGQDKVKVAHGGRVKVKADAQFGPISTGDLLVSSGTTGYAMRSAPIEVNGISLHRPGTIVGKALEPLNEGQGEILVLLTLQ